MRYDDASQAGSMATDSAPTAHADVEAIPPGGFGASGNAITGAGTISGSAGADSVANGPARIVEVHGSGGPTSESGSGFQALGQYGVLTMDAQGNFNYARNANTPEGVQDVFGYTIADRNGATSSTTLTMGIGPSGPGQDAAAAAAAAGVVNLPPGVEMSDIHVNGRDLVITMPDGTQMVIPGGAVFVPQLVIGDVEVPANNLAALLVDSEPKPAAGPLQSSGGNFANPVPPLDPGVPLGDLIPPTELTYVPPEFHEVNQFEDDEPEIVIIPDGQPAAVNAVDSVDEAGLPARTGEPEGSGEELAAGANGDPSEATSGVISIDSRDGIDSVTINGVEVTGVAGQQIAGAQGILTITSVNFATGQIGYTYVLTDNTNPGGDNISDLFSVTITDDDGDTATATLTIDIIDDTPIARDDTDSLGANDTSAAGNVITGVGTTNNGADTQGADGLFGQTNDNIDGVTGIHAGTTGSFAAVAQNGTVTIVHGQFGDLAIDNDGNYTYTRTDFSTETGGNDVFTYQITDGDGDNDTATLTISVPGIPDTVPEILRAEDALVDEDGLQNANVDSNPLQTDPDETDSTESATDTGSILVDYKSDVPGNLLSAIHFINPSSLNGQLETPDGTPITFTIDGSGHLVGSDGTNNVIVISITGATPGSGGQVTYTYEVDLLGPVQHLGGTELTSSEDTISLTGIQFEITDSDGDHASSSFDVAIVDDVPTAGTPDTEGLPTLVVDESPVGQDEGGDNDPAGVRSASADFSGSFSAPVFGADGPGTVTYSLSLSSQGASSGLFALDPNAPDGKGAEILLFTSGDDIVGKVGNVVYFTISVDPSGTDAGTVTFTQANGLNVWHADTTSDDDTSFLDAADHTIVLHQTVTDGDGDTDSSSIDLSNNTFQIEDDGPSGSEEPISTSIKLVVDESPLGQDEGGDHNPNGIRTDSADFSGAFAGAIHFGTDGPGHVDYGLVLSSEGAGSGLYALDANDTTTSDLDGIGQGAQILLYTEADGSITGRTAPGGQVYFTISVGDPNATITFEQSLNIWHGNTGSDDDTSTLTALAGTLELVATVYDADGDSDTVAVDLSSGVFNVEDDGPHAVADVGSVDEGATLIVNTANGVLSNDSFGTDGPGSITGVVAGDDTSSPIVNSNVGVQIDGDFGKLTLNANGSYTYVSTDGAVPPEGATDTFVYTIRDADGDTETVTLTINLADVNKIPVANTPDEVWLDDDTLAGGNAGGPGDRSPDTQNTSGSLTGSGGDGDLDFYLTATQTLPTGFTSAFDGSAPAGEQWLIISQGGTPVIKVTLVNETGAYTVTQLAPIDHALDGNTEGEIPLGNLIDDINVSFVARDENGDNSTPKNLTISVDDDTPVNNSATVSITVHEDALNNANAVGNSTGEGTKTVSGSISIAQLQSLVSPGADGPVTIGLNSAIDGVATGLTQNGVSIVWDYVDATHVRGLVGNDPAHVAFTITLDSPNGEYDFTLLDNIDNNPLTGAGDADTDSLSLANVFTATDGDGDTIVIDAGASVNIENDVPTNNAGTVSITVHEDALNNANAVGNSTGEGTKTTTGSITVAQLQALVNPGADSPVTIGLNSAIDGVNTGLTQNGVAIVWDYVDATHVRGLVGNDPAHVAFTITFDAPNSEYDFTLLDNIDNNPLTGAGDADTDSLSLANVFTATDTDGDKVIIDAGASVNIENDVPTNNAGTVSITVHEDALNNANAVGNSTGEGTKTTTGSITVAQLQALVNPGADSPVTIGLNSAIDGVNTGLTQNGVAIVWDYVDATHVRGLVNNDPAHVAFTITFDGPNSEYDFTLLDNIDNNPLTGAGDADTDSLSLANVFTATDTDGDKVIIDAGASVNIENDVPVNNTVSLTTPTVHEDALNNANAIGNNEGGKTTTASITVAQLQSLVTPGADSPVAISFNSAIDGVNTGLTQNGVNIVWDYVDATHARGLVGNDPSKVAFTVTFDGPNSEYDFTLLDNIDHDNDANLATGEGESFIETLSLDNVFKATDTDGDSVIISGGVAINIENDAPVNFSPVDLIDTDDSTVTTQDNALVNDGTANVTRLINDANNDGTGENFIGADGFGSLLFTATGHTNGEALKDANGVALTSHGNAILVTGFGTNTLTAYVESGATAGFQPLQDTVVFTASLNAGTGFGSTSTYTIDFNDTIDDGSGITISDFSTAPAGQNDWIGLDSDGNKINVDNNDSPDLLLTPTNAGGTVNTSSSDIGNSNQWIDNGEGIRIDFVQDVRYGSGDEKVVAGYTFDSHYAVHGTSFSVMQTQGGGNAAIRIAAYNDPDTGTLTDLTGSIVAIDQSSIVVTGDTTYTIVAMGDGTFVITGLNAGANVSFNTVGGADYDAIAITSADGVLNPATPSPSDTFSGAPFAIGEFGYFTALAGNNIDLALGVTATDADGDKSTGTIDVTLVPDGSSSFSSLSSLSANDNLRTASTNTMIMSAALAAAGLESSAAAAPSDHGGKGSSHDSVSHFEAKGGAAHDLQVEQTSSVRESLLVGSKQVSDDPRESGNSSGSHSGDQHGDHSVSNANDAAPAAVSALAQGEDSSAASDAGTQSVFTTQAIVMPGAELLAAGGKGEGHGKGVDGNPVSVDGNAQHNEVVGKVLADALHGGGHQGPDIDALVNAASGGGHHAGRGLEALASHGAGGVPNGDMAVFAAFTGHGMHGMDPMTMHQDAAPSNG